MLTYSLTADGKPVGTITQTGEYTVAPGANPRAAGRIVRWAQHLLGNSPEVTSAAYRTPAGVWLAMTPTSGPLPLARPVAAKPPAEADPPPRTGNLVVNLTKETAAWLRAVWDKKMTVDEFERRLQTA